MAAKIPETHFTKDCVPPKLEKGVLRLYAHRFSQFSRRVKAVLAHKQIPHEVVNCVVTPGEKPQWLLDMNPLGQVPVLQYHGDTMAEPMTLAGSLACCDYLEERYPENKLTPDDPKLQDLHYKLGEEFQFVDGLTRKAAVFLHTDPAKMKEIMDEMNSIVMKFEDLLQDGQKFFGGEEPTMLDYLIWPWFERNEPSKKFMGMPLFQMDRFPKLTAWMTNMYAHPAVKADALNEDHFVEFALSFFKTGKLNYDVGLKKLE